ncbi:MAG: sigma-70 family RNA polymerase sigma factor [Bdellovibrionaceae bacterium]|nr:sigma-70 family RNA polymerase sigma factor [Pseudobdellovibrionaceae bacterium]
MDSSQMPAQAIEQMLVVQTQAPWLLENGKITPEHYLRALTPYWDSETWEKYLTWFENQTGQRAESLVPPRRYTEICESQEESIFSFAQSNAEEDLRVLVGEYLHTLTDLQRRVVEMIFWDGRSTRTVALTLGIRHQSVHRLKIRALNKIKGLLREGATSRIMRGEISPNQKGGTDETGLLLAHRMLPQAS